MLKLAVLISGRGSNMIELVKAIQDNHLRAKITIVVSNKNCAGINDAAKLGIPTKVIERQNFTTRREHDAAIQDAVNTANANFVFLAGYMAVLGDEFINAFAGRLVNIHPSLLPNFKGLNTHQRAIDANAKRHGATVHLVTAKLDGGPIFLQAELSVLPHEDADTLAARVLQLEHQLYPFVLKNLCDKKLTLTADKVLWHQKEINNPASSASTGSNLSQALRWPNVDTF